jgi:hypothetical protein
VKILVIVVRYRTPLSESPALQGLCDAFSSQPDLAGDFSVMIWDNSPEAIMNPQLPIPFLYEHSTTNLGVSGAYNIATEHAAANAYPWMLLLDQDTKITREFLSTMLGHCLDLLPRKEIAVIAPTVRFNGIAISPVRRLFARNRGYPTVGCGIALGEAAAINSGCVMRVESLQAVGGFSPAFWLDYSDLYVFHQFFLNGLKVWWASDAELEHDMTMMDYDQLMTPWRCRNLCAAESAFSDLYDGRLENVFLTLRVFARAIKHRMKYENPEFSRIAWDQFVYRLRVPRAERLARWRAENRERISRQTDRTDEIERAILQ